MRTNAKREACGHASRNPGHAVRLLQFASRNEAYYRAEAAEFRRAVRRGVNPAFCAMRAVESDRTATHWRTVQRGYRAAGVEFTRSVCWQCGVSHAG